MSGYNDYNNNNNNYNNNNNNNNDNQPQDRGFFTGIYDKLTGVSQESTTWSGNYGNPQQQNQGGYGQPPYGNQGGYGQPPNYNQGGGFQGGCVPPPNQNPNPSSGGNQSNATGSGTQNNQYPVVPKSNFGDDIVRYGAKISLKHIPTGRFLSSDNVNYSSGSSQQQITCNQWNAGGNEMWQVLPPVQPTQAPGTAVEFNSVIRLIHLSTKKKLHSHPNIPSPLSGLQEVSGFGNDTSGDDNDLWVIEKFDYNGQKPGGQWNCNDPIALRHLRTNQYLFSHDRQLQVSGQNQIEVACSGSGRDENNKWSVQYH